MAAANIERSPTAATTVVSKVALGYIVTLTEATEARGILVHNMATIRRVRVSNLVTKNNPVDRPSRAKAHFQITVLVIETVAGHTRTMAVGAIIQGESVQFVVAFTRDHARPGSVAHAAARPAVLLIGTGGFGRRKIRGERHVVDGFDCEVVKNVGRKPCHLEVLNCSAEARLRFVIHLCCVAEVGIVVYRTQRPADVVIICNAMVIEIVARSSPGKVNGPRLGTRFGNQVIDNRRWHGIGGRHGAEPDNIIIQMLEAVAGTNFHRHGAAPGNPPGLGVPGIGIAS